MTTRIIFSQFFSHNWFISSKFGCWFTCSQMHRILNGQLHILSCKVIRNRMNSNKMEPTFEWDNDRIATDWHANQKYQPTILILNMGIELIGTTWTEANENIQHINPLSIVNSFARMIRNETPKCGNTTTFWLPLLRRWYLLLLMVVAVVIIVVAGAVCWMAKDPLRLKLREECKNYLCLGKWNSEYIKWCTYTINLYTW